MYSKTIAVVVAVIAVFLPPVFSQVSIQDEAAFNKVKTCMSNGFTATFSIVANEASTGAIEKLPILCGFWQALDACLAETFSPTAGSLTDVLDWVRAFEYQHAFLSIKSGACPDLGNEALGNLVKQSGIMIKNQLPDIMDDPYAPCVGDAHKKCIKELSLAVNVDINLFFSNTNCYIQAVNTCNSLMLQHFNSFMATFKKNMQQRKIIN